jgi:predicted NACHT family NTPase
MVVSGIASRLSRPTDRDGSCPLSIPAMTRTVRQLNLKPDLRQEAAARPFEDFADRPNLVLLGDPGAGKTHVFRQAAQNEGARFIKARAFLSLPADHLRGQALFIDGLDEKRAGRADRDTIDALVEKLFAVGPTKVRISCRVADWLGESDLAGFQPYFEQHGDTPVLLLQSLSRAEQLSVLAGQSVDAASAAAFLDEATERGLDDFLENPQNLIMLWRAVQTGSWPSTRKELFELSTQLMLQEFDQERARSGTGSFSVADLRPAAGAVCAARLISDVEAISLTDQEGTPDIPGYRSVTFLPSERVQAAIGRRIFDAAPESETVDYAHRTTAEFLAAEFLAERIRSGLPFGRVTALMGVDGHPAAELRGLHAWLAVHLPEHADELIEADPYGVLTYGDAASLSPSACACLVRALDRLSNENPWFRSGNWQAKTIGGLARKDMVPEFRAILANPASGFGIRSVVVDALALGPPLPEMQPDLAAVVEREASPYDERAHALAALKRLGEPGRAALRNAYPQLRKSANDIRLRSEVILALYGDPYGVTDAAALINDCFESADMAGSGALFALRDHLPLADLPRVLDGVVVPDRVRSGFDRPRWEVGSLYAHLLIRAWEAPGALDPERALGWLRKRALFKGGEGRARGLRAAMQRLERLTDIARHFFCTVPFDEHRWYAFNQFREAILFELGTDALLEILLAELNAATAGSDRQLLLFEFAIALCLHAAHPRADEVFAILWSLADSDTRLKEVRSRTVETRLPDNYLQRLPKHVPDDGTARDRQQQEFDQDAESIRTGNHIGWLTHIARIYYCLYNDCDEELSPRDRMAAWLGDERVPAALEGLAASVSREDLLTFDAVMSLAANHQHYDWWYALTAGMTERCATGQGLAGLSDDFLKGMLVFDITNPVLEYQHGSQQSWSQPWRNALIEAQPELVRDAYLAVARLRLSHNDQFISGLHELLTETPFEPYRADLTLALLADYPNADPYRLNDMLIAVAKLPAAHDRLLTLARTFLAGTALNERPRDLWLATAYVLSPAEFEATVAQRVGVRNPFIFDLRDKAGFARMGQPAQPLPVPIAEFLVVLSGSVYPDTPHPVGGWGGDTNAWDASEWIRTLVNMISATPSKAATEALERLSTHSALASYRPSILHALANQRQRRRDTEYDRPDWRQTIAALANGRPATAADLHALLVDHLLDLGYRIARANTDTYKGFWNIDSHTRPQTPRPEEACRDHLIDLMRPSLQPLGITVEPEGHMVADKRADVAVTVPAVKILTELKRDYHDKVWTAVQGQLERLYTPDPEAKGFGIYGVFWFGDKRAPHAIPAPPGGKPRPQSAAEMEEMLKDLLPPDMRKRIAVIVFDVSGDV